MNATCLSLGQRRLGRRCRAAQRATALYLRGNAYYEKGDYDRAVADLTESVRLDPGHVDPFYLRGLAYDAKNDHDRAIADFGHALQLKPNNPDSCSAVAWPTR
jgi:tetratricopeptide (TPR) repeat protein